MIEQWIREIKEKCAPDILGMILIHNGIVRATSKDGKTVREIMVSYDHSELDKAILEFKNKEGIVDIRAWINEGALAVGDDIMKICVAGRFRTDVLPAFQELLTIIKRDIVKKEETHPPRK